VEAACRSLARGLRVLERAGLDSFVARFRMALMVAELERGTHARATRLPPEPSSVRTR
jgi:hypothetical protein